MLIACTKNGLETSSNKISSVVRSLKPATYYGLFFQPSDLSLPPYMVINYTHLDATGVLPNSAVNTPDYGDRRLPTTLQPLNYFIRSIKVGSTFENGDFFFEAPILSANFELNATATALTQYLKYGFSQRPQINRQQWENMLQAIELEVANIKQKSTTEILKEIRETSSLNNTLNTLVLAQNPTLNTAAWSGPSLELVWSSPSLKPNSKTDAYNQTQAENSEVLIWMNFWSFTDSRQRIFVDSWEHKFNSTSTSLELAELLNYLLDYNSTGEHQFIAKKSIDSIINPYNFPYTVTNKNLVPTWAENLEFRFTANHLNKINLKTVSNGLPGANDPDGRVDLITIVADVDTPDGMHVEHDANTDTFYLVWLPVYSGTSSDPVMQGSIKIVAKDNDGAEIAVTVPYKVFRDNLPVIKTIPPQWQLTEAIEGSIIIETEDLDNDKVIIEALDSNLIVAGSPTGAGILTFTEISGSTPGHQKFSAKLKPSYLQTIGANQTITLSFRANYDISDGTLSSLSNTETQVVEITTVNADDPPVWTAGGLDTQVIENTSFTNISAGRVKDPNPDSSAMTYELYTDSGLSPSCQWATAGGNFTLTSGANGNEFDIFISGTPAFNSLNECNFQIKATDSHGLYALSNPIKFTVQDVNQAPNVSASAILSYTIDEGKDLNIDLSAIFADPDRLLTPSDPYELLTYSCSDCASLPSPPDFGSIPTTSPAFLWRPPSTASVGSPYAIHFTVTDKGGLTATTAIQIAVNNAPSPVNIVINPLAININEKSTTYFDATLSAASSDAIDFYNYVVSTATTCRTDMITNTGGITSGNSSSSLGVNFKVDANKTTDGNAPYPLTSKSCNYAITVTKADDPTVSRTVQVPIVINNVNRSPIAVVIEGDPGTGPYSINIIASAGGFVSGMWISSYSYTVNVKDLDKDEDATVDKFTYSVRLGSVTNNNWTFKLPSCLRYYSGKTATVNTSITVNDGRNGTKTRPVVINVTNAQNIGCANPL